jgi:hypothetical protein
VEASAAAADDEDLVVLLRDEAVVEVGGGEGAVVQGGVGDLPDLREEAVEVLDLQLLEV